VNTRRRRLGLVVAGMVAALAVVVASLPLIQEVGPRGFAGPSIVPRPLVIAILLGLPAGVAVIAALRGSRPMLIAAGVLCLLQSIVSFGGVTLGFVIPGIVLIALGLEQDRGPSPSGAHARSGRAALAAVLVVGLAIAAWVVPLASGETVCWIARTGPDGNLLYTIIPNSDTLTVGVNDVASGCDGGTFTLQGLMIGGVLAIGALALAALGAGGTRHDPEPPEGMPAATT
jgi:hypothetical protein